MNKSVLEEHIQSAPSKRGCNKTRSPDRACAFSQLWTRRGREGGEEGQGAAAWAGPGDSSRLREGQDGGLRVTFETSGGEALRDPRQSVFARCKARLRLWAEPWRCSSPRSRVLPSAKAPKSWPSSSLSPLGAGQGWGEPSPGRSVGPRLGLGGGEPGWAGAALNPSPRSPARSACPVESAERRMPAPSPGRVANGGGEGWALLGPLRGAAAASRCSGFTWSGSLVGLRSPLRPAFYIIMAYIHLKPLPECKNMDSPCL
nr:uncharacterized protein LOC111749298 [Loxodonta africana]